METKPLLFGLIGFMLGGLLVSVVATTNIGSDKDVHRGEMSMTAMTDSLKGKSGDEYDKAFIKYMIEHHQSAVDMAELSAQNAKHDEIKQLSAEIITAQEKEINHMKQWQAKWDYPSDNDTH